MPVTKSAVRKPAKKAAAVKKVTLDDVWAAIRETQKQVDETQKQVDKTQKQVDETSKVVGNLGHRFGDVAEYTLLPNLPEKFRQYNFSFGRMGQNVRMEDNVNEIYAEINAMLENGTQAMAVEVKVNLKTTDVDDHIKRMEKIRKYADLHGDNRQFHGAVAATVVSKEVELYAIRHGFYVIKPSGEDVTIVPPVSGTKFW